jgi:D-psicose/D-tagatose/L-ribulose 3-epimerase
VQIGVSAFAWTGNFTARHLGLFTLLQQHRDGTAAGAPGNKQPTLSALEVPMFEPSALPVAAIRKAAEAAGLACTVCAILPRGIEPLSEQKSERERARRHLEQCIRATAEAGASLMAGPVLAPIGYLPGHRPTEQEWSWAVELLQQLQPILAANGVTLAVEPVNRAETYFLRTAAEARALCEAANCHHVGVTIDTFHANIEEADICVAVQSLGPWLKHMHMSESDRGILGTGHVPMLALVRTLAAMRYQGYGMLEGFGYHEDEPSAPGYLWANQAVTPEDVAFQGEACLQQVLWQIEREEMLIRE